MAHQIAIAVYDGLLGFEYGLAAEFFGFDRSDMGVDWYEFLPCRVEPGRLRTSHGMEMEPPGTLSDLEAADTIVLAGWRLPLEEPPEPFLEALRRADARGARFVTICTGAFVLAYAGLLHGRRATTHWMHAATLRERFPTVLVEEDALYVHDGRISTSAGSAAGMDACLAIIRADYGIHIANRVARRMVAPVHREGGQSQYKDLAASITDDGGFGPVLDHMLELLDQPISVESVAKDCGFTLRTFQRRFHELTGLSPHQWLSQQRVIKARELLESTDHSVEMVASLSGLGSSANLRKHLARHLGTTPRAYRSAFRAVDVAGAS